MEPIAGRSLFSAQPRDDTGPPPYSCAAYALLDRSPDPVSAEVRRLLDEWYGRLPPAAAVQIHERFGSSKDPHHLGAFLELYLHELAHCLNASVDIDVGRDEGEGRRPDLLLTCGRQSFYVEATAIEGDDVHEPRIKRMLDEVYDAVNAVHAPAFGVDVEVEQIGSGTPSRSKITGRLQRWLDGLDPDSLLEDETHGRPPRRRLSGLPTGGSG